ncbi:MAG: eukaryotic-like serine/threonine-protein kinase [bacterium]
MTVLEPLILPSDVQIVPVDELAPELREQLDHAAGDCSITRPRTRTTSSIVDARTAALLERFRTPATIVDAVIAYSTEAGTDPRATLDEAFAVLGGFVSDGLLVAPDSELARPIDPHLAPGETVGGFEIVASVQVIVDTEVHLARTAAGEHVALKVAREGSEERMRVAFAHEAAMLALLDGRCTPRLLDEGEVQGRPFLAMTWCPGTDVYEAAAEARRLGGPEGRAALLALAEGILEAYAHLHEQDVLHGDVHPRNVLAAGDGAVTIIDFGLAGRPSAPGAPAAGGRGGIDFFMEPEIAQARIAGSWPPALSAAGEQYSVAALLYLLLTGAHTHAFALEQDEMLRQLHDEPPISFARHGVQDLPAIERVLTRALAKQPDERHASVAELRRAFAAATAADLGAAPAPATPAPGPARALLDDVLARIAVPEGELFGRGLAAPSASVQNGAAGFAYALLRIAGIRGDEILLGQADLWSIRAALESRTPDAWFNADLELVPETIGECSLHHTVSGVHAVGALVAGARGDEWSQRLALDAFVAATGEPCEHLDVAFGRAGLLLGCALLLEALPAAIDTDPLRARGTDLCDSLMAALAAQPEIAACRRLRSLGAAHGWAGMLFALLRWSEATGTAPAAVTGEWLAQLAALGQPAGRGTRWPHGAGEPAGANPIASGWCNGAAGYVPLWTLAHRLTGDETYARLAQTAAWTAYEDPADSGDICCGLAGRAYALLNVYRHTNDAAWLARARCLADRAAISVQRDALRRDSLYKGEVGVALLAADLEDPLHACIPLFEGEGWPRHGFALTA